MSIGPMSSIAVSIAGAPLAQSHAGHAARASQDANAQQLQAQNNLLAEKSEGVGAADGEDNGTNDRDADGRRLWEMAPQLRPKAPQDDSDPPPPGKNPAGDTGQTLDLSG